MQRGQKYYTLSQLAKKWAVSRQAVQQLLRRHGVQPLKIPLVSKYLTLYKALHIERLKPKSGKILSKLSTGY